jgi:hypothetical protein
MIKVIMVKVRFGEKFGINNIVNPMTITFVSQLKRWLDGKNYGLSLYLDQGSNFIINSIVYVI